MSLFKSIWMILTGMDREVGKIHDELDRIDLKVNYIFSKVVVQKDVLNQILSIVQKIEAQLTPPPAVSLQMKLSGVKQGDNSMLQVSDTGSVVATLEADDELGNPGAALDAAPTWSLSDPTLGSVNAALDGLSAVVVLTGKLGTFKVHADALAGGKALSADSDDVEVVVGAAALIKVSVAAPSAPSV